MLTHLNKRSQCSIARFCYLCHSMSNMFGFRFMFIWKITFVSPCITFPFSLYFLFPLSFYCLHIFGLWMHIELFQIVLILRKIIKNENGQVKFPCHNGFLLEAWNFTSVYLELKHTDQNQCAFIRNELSQLIEYPW